MRGPAVVVLLTMITASFGCADATIRKVPNRSDYAVWTDEKQREVDGMCGLRFYRSRPYVVVKEPFLVAQESYLVDGVITADGRHALLIPKKTRNQDELTEELRHYGMQEGLVHQGSAQLQVELSTIFSQGTSTLMQPAAPTVTQPTQPVAPASRPQPLPSHTPGGGADGGDTNAADENEIRGAENEQKGGAVRPQPLANGAVTPDSSGDDFVGSEEPPIDDSGEVTSTSAPTGTASLRLSTHLKGIAHKNLGSKFDILYLPDFEEQYVVDPRANLGDLDLQLTQGPGGELLAMGMQVDNSAITRPLVDLYTQAVQKAGSKILGGIGGGRGAPAAALSVSKAGVAQTAPGRVVTLRVHVMKYASPGIYPLLKASEVLENRRCTRDLCQDPNCSGSGSCTTCRGGRRHDEDLGKSHIVPVYPFSRVAYQIHRKVVIEAAVGAPAAPASPAANVLRSLNRRSSMRSAARAPARGLRASAPARVASSNDDIEAMINAVLLSSPQTKCLKVKVTSRTPAEGPRSELEDLDIQFSGRDGAPVEQCTRSINKALALIRSELDFPTQMSLGITFGKFGN